MNKDWDKAVVSVQTWKECLRVLKPGAFAAVMSSPRQDVLSRMIVNLEDAGFNTRFTSIYWTYASGFPKAMNVGKRLNQFDGAHAGFQPKPAVEVILMVMKPLSEKTFVDQALSNGKGVTWLDSCRIPFESERDVFESHNATGLGKDKFFYDGECSVITKAPHSNGRFPANLLVSDDVLNDGIVRKSSGSTWSKWARDNDKKPFEPKHGWNNHNMLNIGVGVNDSGSYSRYFDLDKWFDTTFPFLAVPKASSSEKNKGLDKWIHDGSNEQQQSKKNIHPTVKPLKLMSWLVTLLTRPNETVLDPFCGSGTTLLAAQMLKRNWIGIELNKEYVELAEARLGLEKVANNQF